MKNITLAIEETVLAKVRRIAAERNTTLNALVREHLSRLAEREDQSKAAIKELMRLSEESELQLGKDWKFDRQAIYDRPMLSGHKRPHLRGRSRGDGRAQKKKGA